MAEPDRTNADAERVSDIEAVTNEIPRASEAEALASLREYATGPIKAVFTWSEAATVLELIEMLTKSGIIEVAIRNPSVAEYMAHWEGRAEKAEDIIEAQSKALAEARATGAIVEIAAERQRQKSVEGWTPEHDDEHETGQMASAAACYASPEDFKTKTVPREWSDDSRYMDAQSEPLGRVSVPSAWPWDGQWWKPKDRRRNLVKAAALIVAEIERLDRLTPTPENPNG